MTRLPSPKASTVGTGVPATLTSTARGGFITTKGRSSYGMWGDHGHRITTTGANAHGIVA